MAYATSDDVASRILRPLSPAEVDACDTLLDDAERLLVDGIPDLREHAATDADYADAVVQVEAAMLVRILKNPGGYRTMAEGGVASNVDSRAAAGFFTVLDDEWSLLGGAGASEVFTVAPVFTDEPSYGGDVWRPV